MLMPLVLLHIASAAVGLLSGFMAMAFRKGSGLHGAAGSVFFVSMLSMSGLGAFMAAFLKPNNGNVLGGLLTFYLVATGWVAARRRDRRVGMCSITVQGSRSRAGDHDYTANELCREPEPTD